MSKMNWDGNIRTEEQKRTQKLPKPEDSSQKRKVMQTDRTTGTEDAEQRREKLRSQERRSDRTGSVAPQPVEKPEHTIVRGGPVKRQEARESRSDRLPPPPSVGKGSRDQEAEKPVRKPEHTVVRSSHTREQEAREPQSDRLPPPPSVRKGSEQQDVVQPMHDTGAPVSIDVRSYRRHRSGRTFAGNEMLSPVNIIGMLITLAGIVLVVLNWHTVTLTLARWVLYALVNLGTILLLLVGIAVLVLLVRGRRGRGGVLRRLFR